MKKSTRRSFIRNVTALGAGAAGLAALLPASAGAPVADKKGIFVIGPMEGYSPQIGTIVSMLNYNRQTVIDQVESLSTKELDFLFDAKSNTIGALIMHLGAVDQFYQLNTFQNREMNDAEKKAWGAAMELGDAGRKEIKGNDVKYYLNRIAEVRQKTLEEFKKKDDQWLMAIDPEWSKEEPLNTYWKWFHVCEHESNHRGQITWLRGRLPGAKAAKE